MEMEESVNGRGEERGSVVECRRGRSWGCVRDLGVSDGFVFCCWVVVVVSVLPNWFS